MCCFCGVWEHRIQYGQICQFGMVHQKEFFKMMNIGWIQLKLVEFLQSGFQQVFLQFSFQGVFQYPSHLKYEEFLLWLGVRFLYVSLSLYARKKEKEVKIQCNWSLVNVGQASSA